MHDTPPPTRFSDGSFNAQVREELVITPAGGGSGRFHHRFVPGGGAAAPFIAHLKVTRGNGDVLYFDPTAETSVIKIWLEKDGPAPAPQGNLVITGGADVLIDSDSRLNGPTAGVKGRRRYDHPGSGVGFHISRIIVEKPDGTVRFDVTAPNDQEEYTVMVWHRGDDHDHDRVEAPAS